MLAAGRRAARVPPTRALADAAVEPRLLGPGRLIGGLIALAGAAPLFAVATTTQQPGDRRSDLRDDRAVPRRRRRLPRPDRRPRSPRRSSARRSRGSSPVGGFLASANLRTATRRFSSATTPLVLTVAMSCTLLFSTTTIDHAVTQERNAGLAGDLAVTSAAAACRRPRWPTCAPRPACAPRSR